MENTIRIALIGAMGIGKTTAIREICGSAMTDCDVPNLDVLSHDKQMTTVGVEFGEVDLGDGEKLSLYGCPGQDRFDFVRSWVLSIADGVFIMVDVNDKNAALQATRLLDEIAHQHSHCVVAILSARVATAERTAEFISELGERNTVTPILNADVRNRQELLDTLQVLTSMLMLVNPTL